MTSVDVQTAIPPEIDIPPAISSAKAILNSKWVEYPPSSQETFSKSLNDIIEFKIGDNVSHINFPMSYIRFNLLIDTSDTYRNADVFVQPDFPGIDSLFSEITVRTVNGYAEVEDRLYYNRDAARRTALFGCPEELQRRRLLQGNGRITSQEAMERLDVLEPATDTDFLTFTALPITGGALLTILGDYSFLQEGMQVHTTPFGVANTLPGYIKKINGNNQIVMSQAHGIVGAALIETVYAVRPAKAGIAAREATSLNKYGKFFWKYEGVTNATTATYSVIYQPDLEIWKKVFPVSLILGGLQFRFVLEDPDRALVGSRHPEFLTTSFSYTITSPRFIARMIHAHPSIRSRLTEAFKSSDGIQYPMRGTRVLQVSRDAGQSTDSIIVRPGLRSVRGVTILMQDSVLGFQSSNAVVRGNHSISHSLRSGITEAFMQIGSIRLPENPLEIDELAVEAYFHALMYAKSWDDKIESLNMPVHYWSNSYAYPVTTTSTDAPAKDARMFMLVFDFSRSSEPWGYLTGFDTTQADLNLQVKRQHSTKTAHSQKYYAIEQAFKGTLRYMWFVDYDQLVTINRNGVNISR